MDKMIFLNIAWMKSYKGVINDDQPIGGGRFVYENGYGSEVYNFQPFRGTMYGFVEAGYEPQPRCINITRLGAYRFAQSISGILVVWTARHPYEQRTLVIGWYKNAAVYRQRQIPPEGSNRKLPSGGDAEYFVKADEQDCRLIPTDMRDFEIRRGKGGLGQANIWYADGPYGANIKAKVIKYVGK